MTHPIHPLLVHFPVACWSLATVCDVAGLFAGHYSWHVSGIFLVAGTVLAIPAMLVGMLEFAAIGRNSQAAAVASRHATFAIVAFLLYAITLAKRISASGIEHPAWEDVVLSLGGLLALGIAGWFGGVLVYTHGIGSRRTADSGEP